MTERDDVVQETTTFLERNDYVLRAGDPSPYVLEDGRILLTLVFRFPPAPPDTLELRGTTRVGIDLDKVEIIE